MVKNNKTRIALFSQRMGIKPIKKIQINSGDNELRNSLWNALYLVYWKRMEGIRWISHNGNIEILCQKLWLFYFKKPIDNLNNYWPTTYEQIKKYFFNCEWYEVYDFIEFIANNYPDEKFNQMFMSICNNFLEQEMSGYRFIGGKIAPITSEIEIEEIEEALENSQPLSPVNIHLKTALEKLADRKSPDYRNSIKEAISAVEALCKLIAKKEKATLDQGLNIIEKKIGLHPALKRAFSNLYGYTSDAEGIRHALLDEPNLDFEDAKFILVLCSAFINYILNKLSKAKIEI